MKFNTQKTVVTGISAILFILINACSAFNSEPVLSKSVVVVSAQAVLLPKDMNISYVYMTLRNMDGNDVRITDVSSADADVARIRKSALSSLPADTDDGVLIPANGSVELGPRTYFVILRRNSSQLQIGQNVNVVLQFDNGEILSVNTVIQSSRFSGFRL